MPYWLKAVTLEPQGLIQLGNSGSTERKKTESSFKVTTKENKVKTHTLRGQVLVMLMQKSGNKLHVVDSCLCWE